MSDDLNNFTWPEIIAKHLNGSTICIAFITANSLNSHNCRREINFALLKKKYFISVILEPVQMSLGMEMQLSSSQSIFKYTLSSEKEFFAKLYEAKELENCKGAPNYSIEVFTPNDYMDGTSNFDKVRDPFSDRWFAQRDNEITGEDEHCKAEKAARKAAEEEERRKAEEAERARKNKETASMHMLKREKTGEIINITRSPFKIGRSNTADDYVITDNRSISRSHAILLIRNDICYIVDNQSLNKTFVNGTMLVPEKEYSLSNGDKLRLYNERFVYLKYHPLREISMY